MYVCVYFGLNVITMVTNIYVGSISFHVRSVGGNTSLSDSLSEVEFLM